MVWCVHTRQSGANRRREQSFVVMLVPMLMLAPAPVAAQSIGNDRALCADRPGLGTPACTLDEGIVMVEIGLADWTSEVDGPLRSESLAAGEVLVRIGLTPSLEMQAGLSAYGHERVRDRLSGSLVEQGGIGDVTLALRRNFRNPDGSDLSIAAMPFVTLPVGDAPLGAGDWGAGLLLPMSLEVQAISFSLTPQIAAAVDSDRDGRHLALGAVAGAGIGLSANLSATFELSAIRDHDPAGHSTEMLAGFSTGWQADHDNQWDAGINLGLNRASPDVQLYLGYARRF